MNKFSTGHDEMKAENGPVASSDSAQNDAPWRRSGEVTWSVGTVAERLQTSASTLRTWDRRYGLGPTLRTSGGHRRYSSLDIDRVDLMRRLLARGVPAQEAAQVAKQLAGDHSPTDVSSEVTGGPHHHDDTVNEFVQATHRFDGRELARVATIALRDLSTVEAWEHVFVPALITIGEQWAEGHLGVEGEHLASSVLSSALRAHARRQSLPDLARPATVVLASAEEDQHALPVIALEAALSEHGLAALELGPRLPASALRSLLETMRPQVLFLWASLQRPPRDPMREVLEKVDEDTLVVLGGPGWPKEASPVRGIREAVEMVLSRALAP
ncbi:MerR family transcriptional regulator [Aeromicrobium camelliae]|uniref:MerR family transcriptional regulator n=2 Tax=Aeromicrobium camelliae TaxID=1538144 RepID=A0A3N6X5W6_9ACTN|nr:MerR family transcriptional regulator [Aeromicrobium camelliae]